ncbi:FAD-dependent oxidoreductase, partial [Amycolatopsis sp. SID8362]|uniref:FAD-dependent oxidoreductase n=1 Tax=Amycolatopsis sp. SID8362 TaxID=2690346 RepID=UPI001368F7C3
MRVTVAGAGIVGLSCAYRLAEAGHETTVVAAAPPGETTSAVAGGVLYPPVRRPDERIVRWTAETLAALREQHAP